MRNLLFASFILLAAYSTAQTYELSLTVKDETGAAVPFANIALYKSSDSTLAKGTATDINGRASLQAEHGTYYLQVSFLSYQTKTIPHIQLKADKDLGTIALQQNTELLEEVEITAERSQMELKLDKRVFNVGKDLSNVGTNAAEILNNIPSVVVDIEENISLRGSQNVRVLIDGKPSTITGNSTADVLRQFQGNMIEKVEVITNPSARYDAEGEVGIINIILKKEDKRGLNGSVEAVAGHPTNYRTSFNLNYRTGDFNLFTAYGIAYDKAPGGGNMLQRFDNGDTAYVYRSESERERGGLSQNLRLGSEWFINDQNSITLAGFYRFSDETNRSFYRYEDLFSDGDLYRLVTREDIESEDGESLESSLNYRKTFDREDQLFTIDLQWSEQDDLEESEIEEINYLNSDRLLQNTSNREANRTYLIQSDYIHPFGEEGKFETGARLTLRDVNNSFVVEESFNGSEFTINPQYFNDFAYQEDIYAAYLMLGNKINRFSYQFGLRGEYSDIATELKLTNENNSWKYFNLFPSAHLTYELANEDNFQLSYSRRINRPGFRHLLPFQTFSDARNLWRGNPDLQPEYTDSYEFGYLKYFEKGSLFSSVYYRYRTGVIERIVIADEEGFTRRMPVNLSVQHNTGMEFNLNYKFNQKTNSGFNFYRSVTDGSFEEQNLDNEVFTWNNRTTFRAEVLPKLDGQFSLNYRAPQSTPQGRDKALYSIDLSLAKDVLKGNGTLVASVRDLLNSRKRRSITDTPTLYSESEFQWRARQFLLSFTYRINEKKKRPAREGNFGGDDDF